jgi:hypothetical protein
MLDHFYDLIYQNHQGINKLFYFSNLKEQFLI